jgi:hypothetical protein
VDKREMAAELLYYLRDEAVPLYAWVPGPEPRDHFQMTRPFTASAPEPILLLSLESCPPRITGRFTDVQPVGVEHVPHIKNKQPNVYFCRLAGYKDAGP